MTKSTGGGKKIEQVNFRHLKKFNTNFFFFFGFKPKTFHLLVNKTFSFTLSSLTALFSWRSQISVNYQKGLDGTVPFSKWLTLLLCCQPKLALHWQHIFSDCSTRNVYIFLNYCAYSVVKHQVCSFILLILFFLEKNQLWKKKCKPFLESITNSVVFFSPLSELDQLLKCYVRLSFSLKWGQ